MSPATKRTLRGVAAAGTALLGAGFFFAIIGVFGLSLAILAWALFVGLAIVLARRPQPESLAS